MSANKPPPINEATAGPAAVKSPRSRKMKGRALAKAPATGDEEPAAPMSELPHVHAPQQGIHTWRDFIVHIAVITIGLLLAIGLQQIVESVHHQQQRVQLEDQMRETFVANSELIADDLKKLDVLRAYLVDLRLAVDARIHGRSAPPAPAEADPRNVTYIPPPKLGAYEAAKANGTVALLSLDRIRLYERLVVTNGIIEADHHRYLSAIDALRSFRERFESAPVGRSRLAHLDLAKPSTAELVEYRALIGNMLGAAEGFASRLRVLDTTSRAILDGAQTEAELRAEVIRLQGDLPSVPEAVGGNPP